MSNNQGWSNTGERMKDALSNALNTGDFKELNNLVSQTVTTALNEVGIHVNSGSGSWQNNNGGIRNNNVNIQSSSINVQNNHVNIQNNNVSMSGQQGQGALPIWQQRALERAQQKQAQIQQHIQDKMQRRQGQQSFSQNAAQPSQNAVMNLPAVKMRRVGKVSNVLYQVFGGIGLGITGFITLIRLFVFLAGDTTLEGWIVNFIFLAVFYGMVRLGIWQKHRLKRAVRYVQLCGHKMYEDIENLAKATGKSVRYVTKDLQKMLDLGFFPEGHMDEQKTCLILNDTIYRQYLETEANRRFREKENRITMTLEESTPVHEKQPAPEASDEQASELDIMVREGMECIRRLRDLNDRIPGEVISAKLFRMENLLKDIFDSLKEHPDQMHRMHKVMSYYLPTTLKLVEAYEEFDRVSSPGEEIIKAKAEIENTLDTINQAFTELLNNLFQDTVFDVTTDAQVLKTMLAREGLMREMELVPNRQEEPEPKQAQYMKE